MAADTQSSSPFPCEPIDGSSVRAVEPGSGTYNVPQFRSESNLHSCEAT